MILINAAAFSGNLLFSALQTGVRAITIASISYGLLSHGSDCVLRHEKSSFPKKIGVSILPDL